MSADVLNSLFLNTLVLASLYIIASLGFAFIFNMMGTINLAHGALCMASALICYHFSLWFGVNNWTALVLTIIVMVFIGIALERFLFRPFASDITRVIMVGVALMTLMQTAATVAVGTIQHMTIDSFMPGTSIVLNVSISNERLLTMVIGFVILIAVLLLVNKTAIGRQMQAIAQNRKAAALQGINIIKVCAIVCALGLALVAVAGVLMGSYQQISATMGDAMMLRILMLVMLAGAGSMNGLIITGFIIGFMDSMLPLYFDGAGASAIASLIVLVLMLVRPKGFFGYEQ